jgi:hypothetical protein
MTPEGSQADHLRRKYVQVGAPPDLDGPVLVLAGYDRGTDPATKRYQKEMEKARNRLRAIRPP